MPSILFVLFIALIIPFALSSIGIYFRISELGAFDNCHPRYQQSQLTGAGARVVAAQKNAWEALIFFGGAMLIAVAANVDLNTLSMAGYTFLGARIIHPIVYIANLATLRSVTFAVGWFACVYIVYVSLTNTAV